MQDIKPDTKDEKLGSRVGKILTKYSTILILLIMVVALSIMSPYFLTYSNILNIIRQISVIAILGLGVTMVIISGGIDLSSGSVVGLVSVMVAVFAHPPNALIEFMDGLNRIVNYPEVQAFPLIVPILVGLAVGALIGLANGIVIAYGKIPPFIVTLGMMAIAQGLAYISSNAKPIGSFSFGFLFIGRGAIFGIPFPIILLFILVLISHYIMAKTSFGRHIYAIGGNSAAARAAGINIQKHLVIVYTYAGMMTALGAMVITSRITSGQVGLGDGMEFDAITAAVIGGASLMGGIGIMPGTLLGALIVGVLKNGLTLMRVSAYWQLVFTGIIIIGAVLLDARRHAARSTV